MRVNLMGVGCRRGWFAGGAAFCCRAALVIVCAVSLFLLLTFSQSNDVDTEKEKLEQRLAELQSHLDRLRLTDREKDRAFFQLKNQVDLLLASVQENKLAPNTSALFWSAAQRSLLLNVSTAGDVSVPTIFDQLPHLFHLPSNALLPSLRLAKRRRHRSQIDVVIGIPTIKRPKMSYLVSTLRSLIDNLTPAEAETVLIVVMIADEKGAAESNFVRQQSTLLTNEFSNAVDNGLLEIIVPPAAYYPPDLSKVPSTFGDPVERMYWRTKQNLDYAYLMMYCQKGGTYYLQLEDDIITKAGYLSRVKEFVKQQSSVSPNWLMLEFSSLGFIGKLFHSTDLPWIVQFLLIFYREKPVDWLLDLIFTSKYCSPEKPGKLCREVVNKYRIRLKPSLFQHIGVQSSLKGKVQKLKEKDFGKPALHRAHTDNPQADVSTSLKIYQQYSLEKAYKGETFFWALLPQPNDWVRFDFKPPVALQAILLHSGNAEHPDDRFMNTTVEAKFVDDSPSLAKSPPQQLPNFAEAPPMTFCSWRDFRPASDGYRLVSWFSEAGTAQIHVNCSLATAAVVDKQPALVESLRLVVHAESQNWLILSEVWFKRYVEF